MARWRVNDRFSWEKSRVFSDQWDCYNLNLSDKNKLLRFHLLTSKESYRQNFDKLLLSNPKNSGSNFSYFDFDTLLPYQKGLNDKKPTHLYRRENITVFTSVYDRHFYNDHSNPSQEYQSKFDLSQSKPYADIVTLNCGTDILITGVHSELVQLNSFSVSFKKHLLLPSLDNLIFSLQKLVVQKKSDIQLLELRRSAHSYLLNHFVRLDSRKTLPLKDNEARLVLNPKLFSCPIFNVQSFHLNLEHSLPFEQTIYHFNSVLTFLKKKKALNQELIFNHDREDSKVNREGEKNKFPWHEKSERKVSCDPCSYAVKHPDLTCTSYIPRSLLFISAVKLRNIFQNQIFSAHPVKEDFTDLFAHASHYFDRAVPVLDSFLTNLVQPYQRDCHLLTDTFPSERNFEKHQEYIRYLELTCRPKHCIFQLKTNCEVITLNSGFLFRPYFLVATSKFPKLILTDNFSRFIPLYTSNFMRDNFEKMPNPFGNLAVTGYPSASKCGRVSIPSAAGDNDDDDDENGDSDGDGNSLIVYDENDRSDDDDIALYDEM